MTKKEKKLVEKAIEALEGEELENYNALDDAGKDSFAADVLAAAKAAADEATAAKAVAVVEALALKRCHYGNCGEVVSVPEADLEAAEAAGLVDSNPNAVKAAKG